MDKYVLESHGRNDAAMKACILLALALAKNNGASLCILVPTWNNVDNTYVPKLFGCSAMKRFHARKQVLVSDVSVSMESWRTFNPIGPYSAVALLFPCGSHAIPETNIRERFTRSLENLIALLPVLPVLPVLHECCVFDNSYTTALGQSDAQEPISLLHLCDGEILESTVLQKVPDWA